VRLATLKDGSRDGRLVLVARNGERVLDTRRVVPTLQAALDDWDRVEPELRTLAELLERGMGEKARGAFMAPLPRAYEWLDGSAFLNHVELVRRARGAEMPPSLYDDPLMYQGGSGCLLGPNDEFVLPDESWGLDLEAEVACVLSDVPRGTTVGEAQSKVRLLLLANDWSYRNLIPNELGKGFGFVLSKPATAFSPCAVTVDELGAAWSGGRIHLPLVSELNGERLGDPDAGSEMHFSFFQLIAHVARTRSLTAGTIVGSGTVSNRDPARGVSCLAERRMREKLELGEMKTRFLRAGDRVRIEMLDKKGWNVFGSIEQEVVGNSES
jgi:fumarylacetoacetate (FAA) hydrolase